MPGYEYMHTKYIKYEIRMYTVHSIHYVYNVHITIDRYMCTLSICK